MSRTAAKEWQMGKIIDKTKGKIKQAAGVLTGDKSLEREGERDERKGKVKGAVEDVKKAVKDAKNAVKDAAK
jgi:uncharacterized protein YjbJ (UPF0337 family)